VGLRSDLPSQRRSTVAPASRLQSSCRPGPRTHLRRRLTEPISPRPPSARSRAASPRSKAGPRARVEPAAGEPERLRQGLMGVQSSIRLSSDPGSPPPSPPTARIKWRSPGHAWRLIPGGSEARARGEVRGPCASWRSLAELPERRARDRTPAPSPRRDQLQVNDHEPPCCARGRSPDRSRAARPARAPSDSDAQPMLGSTLTSGRATMSSQHAAVASWWQEILRLLPASGAQSRDRGSSPRTYAPILVVAQLF
jgi:hypothetical protein